MAFLSVIYKHGIWISIPAFIFFVILLIICITGVVRTGRQARLLSVPLVDRQEIGFIEVGKGGPLHGGTNTEQTFRETGVRTHGAWEVKSHQTQNTGWSSRGLILHGVWPTLSVSFSLPFLP
jgi:hypothetical protein